MTSAAKSVTHTTKTVNNRTGVTKSVSTKTSGGSTTVTRTTTIGKAKSAGSTGKKAVSTPAKAAGAVLEDTRWITGPNDTRDLCGPVALANALLATTGVEAPNGEIERLYKAAGGIGDTGAPVPYLLAEAAASGLAGCRVASYEVLPSLSGAGLILMELNGGFGVHAAAVTPAGAAVMWSAEIPLDGLDAEVFAAWSLTWQ